YSKSLLCKRLRSRSTVSERWRKCTFSRVRRPAKARDWVLFPEAFVSAYPRWLDFGAVIGSRSEEGREDFRRYWESSVDIPSPAIDALSRKTQSHSIYLV